MNYYLEVINKYVVFKGRARRAEYWYFILINSVIIVILNFISKTIGDNFHRLNELYSLAVGLPTLAVSIRRLHDIGKSGWWWLLNLIPIIGTVWLIVLHATKGNVGANRYGPNPKE